MKYFWYNGDENEQHLKTTNEFFFPLKHVKFRLNKKPIIFLSFFHNCSLLYLAPRKCSKGCIKHI